MTPTPCAPPAGTEADLVRRLQDHWAARPSFTDHELIQQAAATIDRLTHDLVAARAENTLLRAALAVSKDPCRYCQLPADEMARCRAGFPGCARMDDVAGCPEFGAMMEQARLVEELAEARAAVRDAEQIAMDLGTDDFLTSHAAAIARAQEGRG